MSIKKFQDNSHNIWDLLKEPVQIAQNGNPFVPIKTVSELFQQMNFTEDELDDEDEDDLPMFPPTNGFVTASALCSKEICLNIMVNQYNKRYKVKFMTLTPAKLLDICTIIFINNWWDLRVRRDLAIMRDPDTILDLFVSRLPWCFTERRSSMEIADSMSVYYFMHANKNRSLSEYLKSVMDSILVHRSLLLFALQEFTGLYTSYQNLEDAYADEGCVSLVAARYRILKTFIDTLNTVMQEREYSLLDTQSVYEMLSLLAFASQWALEGLEFYRLRFEDDYIHDLEIMFRNKLLLVTCHEAISRTQYSSYTIKKALMRLVAVDA
jgi:hypothetical protein